MLCVSKENEQGDARRARPHRSSRPSSGTCRTRQGVPKVTQQWVWRSGQEPAGTQSRLARSDICQAKRKTGHRYAVACRSDITGHHAPADHHPQSPRSKGWCSRFISRWSARLDAGQCRWTHAVPLLGGPLEGSRGEIRDCDAFHRQYRPFRVARESTKQWGCMLVPS